MHTIKNTEVWEDKAINKFSDSKLASTPLL